MSVYWIFSWNALRSRAFPFCLKVHNRTACEWSSITAYLGCVHDYINRRNGIIFYLFFFFFRWFGHQLSCCWSICWLSEISQISSMRKFHCAWINNLDEKSRRNWSCLTNADLFNAFLISKRGNWSQTGAKIVSHSLQLLSFGLGKVHLDQ